MYIVEINPIFVCVNDEMSMHNLTKRLSVAACLDGYAIHYSISKIKLLQLLASV